MPQPKRCSPPRDDDDGGTMTSIEDARNLLLLRMRTSRGEESEERDFVGAPAACEVPAQYYDLHDLMERLVTSRVKSRGWVLADMSQVILSEKDDRIYADFVITHTRGIQPCRSFLWPARCCACGKHAEMLFRRHARFVCEACGLGATAGL